MDVGVDLLDRVHHVEVADDVVHLRVDRVLAVDHGVRRRALLPEVDDGIGPRLGDDAVGEGGVGEVADAHVDRVAGYLLPARDAILQGGDGHEAVDAHLAVVLAAHEVVDDGDLMAPGGQVQGRRPSEVPVSP